MYQRNYNRHDIRSEQLSLQKNGTKMWNNQKNLREDRPIPPSNYSGTLYISDGHTNSPNDKRDAHTEKGEIVTPKISVQPEYSQNNKRRPQITANTTGTFGTNTEKTKNTDNMKEKGHSNAQQSSHSGKTISVPCENNANGTDKPGELGRGGFPKIDWSGKKGYFRKQYNGRSPFSTRESDCKKETVNDYTVGSPSSNIFENISLSSDDIILAALIIMLLSSKSSGEATDDILILVLTVLLMSGLSKQCDNM